VGERSGRRFALGDQIQVVLRGAQPEQGKLDLQMVPTSSERTRRPDRRGGGERSQAGGRAESSGKKRGHRRRG